MKPVHPSASPNRTRLGVRLRASRKDQGLTIEQLADATGLTKGFISRVERDQTSPSVATLATWCQVLSLPIGSLFEDPPLEIISLADAPLINMGGLDVVERMLSPRSLRSAQLLRSEISAGGSGGDDLYTINCEVEIIHVLRGSLELVLASKTISLATGDTLSLPGSEPHTWRTAEESEILWVLVPAAWSGST